MLLAKTQFLVQKIVPHDEWKKHLSNMLYVKNENKNS